MPSDTAYGKGVGFVPSAVDSACSHLGKVSQEVQMAKGAAVMINAK